MTDLNRLIEEALALGPAERQNLLTRLEYEGLKSVSQPSREEGEVWATLKRLATTSYHRSLTDFLRDRNRGLSRVAYGEAVRELYAFAQTAQPVRHAVQDRAALVEIALECLVGDLEARLVEVTPKTLLEAVPRVRVAVDRCFPGYAAARQLHRLIRTVQPVAAA